ncbi:MAG: hypothetical protein EPO51_25960 [Phenylobacterium sp.]|uniref:S41 family peptidase n=1 Tax=Phenylobacterium sp. TaxID=1871053 RepID=UPI001209215F|nr:S41 family peptidase [Phenylobacterium sp.]TAJ68969.1 MAG: hypothetical protein EPO51_25960 [Phenylobacterium sp.]
MSIRRPALAASLALAAIAAPAIGAEAPATVPAAARSSAATLSPRDQHDVLERFADVLARRFADADTGRRYAARLREQAARRAYAKLSDPVAFGEAVTADLQAVAPDGHLRLAPKARPQVRRPAPADLPASTRASGPPGLEEARMIGDVAYLRFNEFPQDTRTGEAARAFLLAHADARAVILDLRPHRGGGQATMDVVLPLFYAQPATLLRMDTRAEAEAEAPLEVGPTMVRQPGPDGIIRRDHVIQPDPAETRLRDAPLYVLTSRRTASAAEHLVLGLKRTHRAVVVGETTAGAGRFGGFVDLPHGFAAFVPIGRTYDPDTGLGWEGRGVAPDVAAPADDALAVALAHLDSHPTAAAASPAPANP